VPLGARILKLALDFDKLIEAKLSYSEAFTEIERRGDWYQPSVVEALRKVVAASWVVYDPVYVKVGELTMEMILAADIMSVKGEVLIAKGQDVTLSLRMRLENFLVRGGIEEPIKVLVPRETPAYRGYFSPLSPGAEAFDGRQDHLPRSASPSSEMQSTPSPTEEIVLTLPRGRASEFRQD
jgi:hypothetical protein